MLLITAADPVRVTGGPPMTVFGLPPVSVAALRVPRASDLAQAMLGILPVQTISGRLPKPLGCADGEFLHHQDDTKVD